MNGMHSPEGGPLGVWVGAVDAPFVIEIFALDKLLERFPSNCLVHSVARGGGRGRGGSGGGVRARRARGAARPL